MGLICFICVGIPTLAFSLVVYVIVRPLSLCWFLFFTALKNLLANFHFIALSNSLVNFLWLSKTRFEILVAVVRRPAYSDDSLYVSGHPAALLSGVLARRDSELS